MVYLGGIIQSSLTSLTKNHGLHMGEARHITKHFRLVNEQSSLSAVVLYQFLLVHIIRLMRFYPKETYDSELH